MNLLFHFTFSELQVTKLNTCKETGQDSLKKLNTVGETTHKYGLNVPYPKCLGPEWDFVVVVGWLF